jgi:type IV secretion system protein VirB4
MMLREHARRPKSLADLLPWAAMIDPRVVLNKDGSFLGVFQYHGPDLDSATTSELEAAAERLNRSLLAFGSGWVLNASALRRPVERYPCWGEFADPVTAILEQERREQFEAAGTTFVTDYYLTVQWYPPEDRHRALLAFLVSGAEEGEAASPRRFLASFLEQLGAIKDRLDSTLRLTPLEGSALLSYLHESVTGHRHAVRVPENPCYLDVLLASEDFYAGLAPRIGASHLGVVAIQGFPLETQAGALDALNRLPLAYRWSTRWIAMDASRAEKLLDSYRQKWWQKRHSLFDLVRGGVDGPAKNRDAVAQADDAIDAMAAAASGQRGFGYYTTVIVLQAESREELASAGSDVLKALRNAGFAARLEDINAVEAWRGSLPGEVGSNVRRPVLSTMSLSHLLPTTSVWPGEGCCPSPFFPEGSSPLAVCSTVATPFRLNLHVGDVGHTLILGPTGAGKSTLVGFLQAQWLRYPHAQIFAFDKGRSSEVLAHACGGSHYELSAENQSSELTLAPFSLVPGNAAERAWALEWIEALVALSGVAITPVQRQQIDRALASLEPGHTHLGTLSDRIQDQAIRQVLQPYTVNGPYGALLDGDRDTLDAASFQVFELAELMERGERIVVPVLLYLFHRLQQRLDGRPTLIVLEEAWTFLLQPAFADRIALWLRELRKYNGTVVFVSQSLADIHDSPRRSVLYESTPTKIFLPNPEARSQAGSEIYRAIGLNDRQITMVATATPKREYYYTSPLGRRLFDLGLGPCFLAFVGASGRDDLRQARALRAEHGESWPLVWLEQRGQARWARAWRREAEQRRFGHRARGG